MALGPFISYVPPGVYTRTLAEVNLQNVVAGLRIPAIIGVGQEELEQLDLEMVRGSSSTVDTQITAEDESLSWVVDSTNPQNLILGPQSGTVATFRVRNFPLVDGQGFGRVTNDVRSVVVTVNGTPVAIGAVQGAKGLVTLQVPTQPTDVVRCTYYFHRGDTSFTDDVSSQVTATNAALISPGYAPYNIQTGVNDTFVITVNGATATIVFPAGTALTAVTLKAVVDAALVPGLLTSVYADPQGRNHLQFTSTVSLVIGSGNANGPLGFTAGAQTNRNTLFRVFQRPIVDGTSAGLTTTDPSKVVVKVNNVQVVASAVDGTNGIVTLPTPPAPGSGVTIQYFANTWQGTFDYLPNTSITSVIRCGISAGRNDFLQGQDFVIANPSPTVSIVNWGVGYSITPTTTTPGAAPFGTQQIIPTLIDQKIWLAQCAPVINTSVIPATTSATQFLLPEVPTTGNGRNTTLGLPLFNAVANARQDLVTNRPDLVVVYAGRDLRDALNRPQQVVTAVDGVNRQITLKNPLPPDYLVFATFYYNDISDDTFILTCTVPGPVGSGQYTLFSTTKGANLYQTRFGTTSGLAQTVQWPRGSQDIPDAFHTGAGTAVSENVTVTFGTVAATNAVFTTPGAAPYNFFDPTSGTWGTNLNGTAFSVTLATAARGWLVGARTPAPGNAITVPASPNNVLNFTIDGQDVSVTFTPGVIAVSTIVSAINAAIDAVPAFAGTAPNNLAIVNYIGGAGGDIVLSIQSYSTPTALPGGFDASSYVRIRQGTIENVLGFTTFQRADGTSGAINKPATILGTLAGPFNITMGLNDQLLIRVNGVDYTVTLTSGTTVPVSQIVTDIITVPGLALVASAGTLGNSGKLRLTSPTNDTSSAIIIGAGTANTVLGLTGGAQASQTLVGAQEVVDVLMTSSLFLSNAYAYPHTINGNTYVTIGSVVLGATSSTIAFTNTVNSAFNIQSGTGIIPGTSGDVGEDARDNFEVTSNNPGGSAGLGTPGQTYTDAKTGLRFTVLPATTGSYTPGGLFTLIVSQTFNVSPNVPTYAVNGLELIVSNTVNVGVNDTSTLFTFAPSGVEPKNGDFYFISYRFLKQDFSTRLFQQLKTIEANFGTTSAENRVSLAAFLAILNGAILVAIKQVAKVPNTNQASDADFIGAINALATPLAGNVKPDIIVPLGTSTSIYAALTNHCEVQSGARFQSERMGFIGFGGGTTPTAAQSVAKSLLSNRIIAFYPDTAVITLTDEVGNSFESLVDGTFFAAAVAGAVVSPSVDVATPYSRRRIQGFTRLPRVLDPVEANQTAVAGVTIIEDLVTFLRIRQGFTTNMANVLTRLPTVTQISDFVQQQSRSTLDSFVGTKFLSNRVNEVEVSMTALFKTLIQAEIIGAFADVTASVDTTDPTVLQFSASYQPIFPLLYLVLTFNLRAQI